MDSALTGLVGRSPQHPPGLSPYSSKRCDGLLSGSDGPRYHLKPIYTLLDLTGLGETPVIAGSSGAQCVPALACLPAAMARSKQKEKGALGRLRSELGGGEDPPFSLEHTGTLELGGHHSASRGTALACVAQARGARPLRWGALGQATTACANTCKRERRMARRLAHMQGRRGERRSTPWRGDSDECNRRVATAVHR
jgi:hypothetical protein